MKNKKTALCALLALILILSLFGSCTFENKAVESKSESSSGLISENAPETDTASEKSLYETSSVTDAPDVSSDVEVTERHEETQTIPETTAIPETERETAAPATEKPAEPPPETKLGIPAFYTADCRCFRVDVPYGFVITENEPTTMGGISRFYRSEAYGMTIFIGMANVGNFGWIGKDSCGRR